MVDINKIIRKRINPINKILGKSKVKHRLVKRVKQYKENNNDIYKLNYKGVSLVVRFVKGDYERDYYLVYPTKDNNEYDIVVDNIHYLGHGYTKDEAVKEAKERIDIKSSGKIMYKDIIFLIEKEIGNGGYIIYAENKGRYGSEIIKDDILGKGKTKDEAIKNAKEYIDKDSLKGYMKSHGW